MQCCFNCGIVVLFFQSDSATNFHKTIPFLESLLKNSGNFLNFSCDLGLRRDEAVAIYSSHGYDMKLYLQEVITKCEQGSTEISSVDITKALAETGVVECNSTSQYGKLTFSCFTHFYFLIPQISKHLNQFAKYWILYLHVSL